MPTGACGIDYEKFPCDRFRAGPYPFSRGYLSMQERRRKEISQAGTSSGNAMEVPSQYWEDLEQRELDGLCANALVKKHSPNGILLPFFKKDILLDIQKRCLCRQKHDQWERIDDSLLELISLVYLLNVSTEPLSHELVSVKDLKTGHFFKGPHELKIRPLLDRYGHDMDGFKRSAEHLGGELLDMADASYKFLAFPKVPLYYLFWQGDQEFQSNISILFDRSIEDHLAADAIWGVVNLVSDSLLRGDIRGVH